MKVLKANLHGDTGSRGDARYKLVCQHDFPYEYGSDDELWSADHDRLLQWNFDHATQTIKRHTGSGDMRIGQWAATSRKEDVFAFLKDIFNYPKSGFANIKSKSSDDKIEWTGYRILATVNRSNGYTVFSLELFAKGKTSITEVFSGPFAPNVNDNAEDCAYCGPGQGPGYDGPGTGFDMYGVFSGKGNNDGN